jgi:hypothetical protein
MRTRSTYTLLEVPSLPTSAKENIRGLKKVVLFAGLQGLMKSYTRYTDQQVFKGSEPH